MVAEDLDELEDEAAHEDYNHHLACEGIVAQDLACHNVIGDVIQESVHEDLGEDSGQASLSELSWLRDVQEEGLIQKLDVTDDYSSGWSSPPGHFFQVRGEDYLTSKVKIPGGETLLHPIAFDWIKSKTGRIDAILQNSQNRIANIIGKGCLSKGQLIWAFNVQVPSREHYSLIAYYISTGPNCEGSLIDRFIKGDDEFKNSRLKLIASVVKGPWAVKSAVGDHTVCLLGRSLSCRYIQGENIMEVDIDLGSSIVANAIVHLAINYVKTLTVDLAFLIEGRTKDELPEKILGTIRFSKLELGDATPLGMVLNPKVVTIASSTIEEGPVVSKEKEAEEASKLGESLPFEEKKVEESFQSHFWTSLRQGLSIDWWGRQEL